MTISSPSFTDIRSPRRRLRTDDDDALAAKVLAARYTALFAFEQLGLPAPNIVDVRSGAILVARVADEAIEQRVLDEHDVEQLRDAPVSEALDRLVQLLATKLAPPQ